MLDELDLDLTSRRFSRLVIASGDGIFADTARRARELGLHVHHVVGRGRPSRELLTAVSTRSRLRLGTTASSPATPVPAMPAPAAA